MNIAVAGLGLIGGSIAKAIHYNNVGLVTGIDIDSNILKKAEGELVINKAITLEELNRINYIDAEIIFICTPVKCASSVYQSIVRKVKKGTIITDVLSVKGEAVRGFIENTPEGVYFISGHPMSGTEKSGYQNSSPALLDQCAYMILPTKKTPLSIIGKFKDIVEKIGARPIMMDIDEHDEMLSIVSHIPHVLSASLLHLAKNYPNCDLRKLVAGSFKDMTRISSSVPDMWASISLVNKNEVIKHLDEYITQIEYFKRMLLDDDYNEVKNYFEEAKEYRESAHYADKAQ